MSTQKKIAVGVVSGGLAALGGQSEAATFTVSNTADAGAGSLRQAIVDANGAAGADDVVFASGVTGTITLTTGQLEITDSLTITGPGAANLTVSGNNASRVFYLYNGAAEIAVAISGLTVSNGAANIGAGLVNFDEDLTLDGMVFSQNAATGDGGGIYFYDPDTSLTIERTTVSGNTAGSLGGGV